MMTIARKSIALFLGLSIALTIVPFTVFAQSGTALPAVINNVVVQTTAFTATVFADITTDTDMAEVYIAYYPTPDLGAPPEAPEFTAQKITPPNSSRELDYLLTGLEPEVEYTFNVLQLGVNTPLYSGIFQTRADLSNQVIISDITADVSETVANIFFFATGQQVDTEIYLLYSPVTGSVPPFFTPLTPTQRQFVGAGETSSMIFRLDDLDPDQDYVFTIEQIDLEDSIHGLTAFRTDPFGSSPGFDGLDSMNVPPIFSMRMAGSVTQPAGLDGTPYYNIDLGIAFGSGGFPPTTLEIVFGNDPENLDTVLLVVPDLALPYTFNDIIADEATVGPMILGQDHYIGVRTKGGILLGVQNIGPFAQAGAGISVNWDPKLSQQLGGGANAPYFFSLQGDVEVQSVEREDVTLYFGTAGSLAPVAVYNDSFGDTFTFRKTLGGDEYQSIGGLMFPILEGQYYYASLFNGEKEISRIMAGVIGDPGECPTVEMRRWYFLESNNPEVENGVLYENPLECGEAAITFFDNNGIPHSGSYNCLERVVTVNLCLGGGIPVGEGTVVTGIGTPVGVGAVVDGITSNTLADDFIDPVGINIGEILTFSGGLVPCPNDMNPWDCNWNKLIQLVENVISFIFLLIIPLASIAFMYAGFLYLFQGGNPAKRQQATKIFLNVLIGVIIILAAWLIVDTILIALGVKEEYRLLADLITSYMV